MPQTKIERLKKFYQDNTALVTSPFIDSELNVNSSLFQSVQEKLSLEFQDKRIIDLGCGTGVLSTFFSDHRHYIGIDLNKRPNFSILSDTKTSFVQANAVELPFAAGSADIVICMDSFEHFPNPQQAVHEIKRILDPKGAVFLSVPNYANVAGFVKWWSEQYGGYDKNTWAPFDFWKSEELEHFVTLAKIRNYFQGAGFGSFNRVGYKSEIVVGLCPWVWHPRMPAKLTSLISKCFVPIAPIINKIYPASSLHLFWKIQ